MKALTKLILPFVTVLLSGCIYVDKTLYAPTRCLIGGVSYKSFPEDMLSLYWPGQQELIFKENGFAFLYERDLESTNGTASLYFKFEHDTAFDIGVQFNAEGYIYISEQKYEITDGWVKFLDFRDISYVSGAFEVTAHSEGGNVVKVTEGFFDELPINTKYTKTDQIWRNY